MKKAKLYLVWLAIGALPVWAQTEAGLPEAPVTMRNVDLGGGADGVDKLTLPARGDYAVRLVAADFRPADIVWGGLDGGASLHQASPGAAPASGPANPDALTWHGITLYGAYDVGLGWVSHGLPENGYNYEGESLVNRNGAQARFVVAPNNLQQTGFGVRGKIEFAPGWFAVFNASTGINPQSGLLANASKTDIINNGLPRTSYSIAIDGARAGQPFNDEYYGGVSSETYGTLTFGRERSLGTDLMLQYDPAGGSYAFSYIGYNGTMAGGGDTEDSRWDDAVKYKVNFGPGHLQAMYKFADGNGGCYSGAAGWTGGDVYAGDGA